MLDSRGVIGQVWRNRLFLRAFSGATGGGPWRGGSCSPHNPSRTTLPTTIATPMSHIVSVSIRSAPLAAVSAAYDTAAGSMGTHACGSMHGPPDESAESGNAVGAYDSLMRDC